MSYGHSVKGIFVLGHGGGYLLGHGHSVKGICVLGHGQAVRWIVPWVMDTL